MSTKSKKLEELTEAEIDNAKKKIAEIIELFCEYTASEENKETQWWEIKKKRRELPSLTKDKELEFGRLLQEGSEKEKEWAGDQLFWANQGIVIYWAIYWAIRYCGRGGITIDFQDLIEAGNEGLKAAIEKYDYKKNCTLGAYAKEHIFWKLFKKTDQKVTPCSLDKSDENGKTLYDRKAVNKDPSDIPAQFWGSDRFKQLTDKEQEVLGQLFDSNCKSLEEAAAELNLSRERVRQIRDKALFKLNKDPGRKARIEDYLGSEDIQILKRG